MSTPIHPITPEPSPPEDSPADESLAAAIAHYGSPDFTKALAQHFHRAKRRALQERDKRNQLAESENAKQELK